MSNNSLFFLWTAKEAIIFLTFIFVCAALAKSRFTAKKTAAIILSGTTLSAALNITVLLRSHDVAFTLGLIPLTTYIPAIIVLHILSDSSFFGTVPTWCMGLFAMYTGRFSVKFTLYALNHITMPQAARSAVELLTLLAFMSVICIVTILYIRKPFNRYIRYSDTNWSIPLVLVLLILAMFSFFSNSPYAHAVTFMLFLVAIAAFFVVAKLLRTEYLTQQLKKEQDEYETRIRTQQEEFKKITRKHELLREYRHDMRHHLLALGNILRNSDNTHAEEYINALVGRLESTENVVYCKNQMINAVLSLYITKAKEIGCVLDTHISIPEKLDIKDMDLCVILSNALENAVNACEKEDENHRHIKIKINFQNGLGISIKNSCNETITFDKNGLPIVTPRPGHGIGMKSIANTVAKYSGIFKCECSDGEFRLNILMLSAAKDNHRPYVINTRRPASAVLFSLIGICLFLNLSPTVAEALADIPVVGSVVRVITVRHYQFGWGQNEFDVKEPKVILEGALLPAQTSLSENTEIENTCPMTVTAAIPFAKPKDNKASASSASSSAGQASAPSTESDSSAAPAPEASVGSGTLEIQPESSKTPEYIEETFPVFEEITEENPALEEGVEEINDKISEYIETLRQTYDWYVQRKYMGYAALNVTYTILCNNDVMLSIRFDGTLNAGSSTNFSRCFTLDKRTGSVVELTDLFRNGTDYITPISSYILEEMTIQAESSNANFFIPGGIWSDEECFKSIAKDQNFYINDQNKLVIVFDECEVAPGSMGIVEFVIPTDTIAAILSELSFIQ